MFTKEIENVVGAIPAFRQIVSLFRLHIDQIDVGSEKIDEVIGKAVWVIVPFHIGYFFLLYGLPQSIKDEVVNMVFVSLGAFAAIVLMGNVVAMIPFGATTKYAARARQLTIASIVIWTTMLAITLLSYLIGYALKTWLGLMSNTQLPRDVVGIFFDALHSSGYPQRGATLFLVYLGHTTLAYFIILIAGNLARQEDERLGGGSGHNTGGAPSPPSTVLMWVHPIVTVLMIATVMYYSSALFLF